MQRSEIETIILINEQDLRDGFFTISTNKKNHAKNIKKRTGIEPIENDGSWQFKLQKSWLSKNLAIRATNLKRNVSEFRKAQLASALELANQSRIKSY